MNFYTRSAVNALLRVVRDLLDSDEIATDNDADMADRVEALIEDTNVQRIHARNYDLQTSYFDIALRRRK